jgi:hypothetical protein
LPLEGASIAGGKNHLEEQYIEIVFRFSRDSAGACAEGNPICEWQKRTMSASRKIRKNDFTSGQNKHHPRIKHNFGGYFRIA